MDSGVTAHFGIGDWQLIKASLVFTCLFPLFIIHLNIDIMNIYAFKPHLSLCGLSVNNMLLISIPDCLYICLISRPYHTFRDSREPFLYFLFTFLFFPLQALLRLFRNIGNIFFIFLQCHCSLNVKEGCSPAFIFPFPVLMKCRLGQCACRDEHKQNRKSLCGPNRYADDVKSTLCYLHWRNCKVIGIIIPLPLTHTHLHATLTSITLRFMG